MFIYLDESGDLGFDFKKRKTTKKKLYNFLARFLMEKLDLSKVQKKR